MAINDVYEVVLGYTQNGQKIINRLHLGQTSADGAFPGNKSAALAVKDDIWPAIQTAVCDDLSLQTIRSRKIHTTIGGSWIETVDEPGGETDDPLPPNSVVILGMYTATASKLGRGRVHISGVPDAWHKDGILDTANVATYAAIITALVGTLQTGADATFKAGLWDDFANVFRPFVFGVVRSHLYTLRSRRMENP